MIIEDIKSRQREEKERDNNLIATLAQREKILRYLKWTPLPAGKDVIISYPTWYNKPRLILDKWALDMACCWCGELSIVAGDFKFVVPSQGAHYVYYEFDAFEVICYFDVKSCKWVGVHRDEEIEVIREAYDDRRLVC